MKRSAKILISYNAKPTSLIIIQKMPSGRRLACPSSLITVAQHCNHEAQRNILQLNMMNLKPKVSDQIAGLLTNQGKYKDTVISKYNFILFYTF
jgi:hypothetical protein